MKLFPFFLVTFVAATAAAEPALPLDTFAACEGKPQHEACNAAYDLVGGAWTKATTPGTCEGPAGGRLFCESPTSVALREAMAAVSGARAAASAAPAAPAKKSSGLCSAVPGAATATPFALLALLALASRRQRSV